MKHFSLHVVSPEYIKCSLSSMFLGYINLLNAGNAEFGV